MTDVSRRNKLYEHLQSMTERLDSDDREAVQWAVQEIHKLWVFVDISPPPPHREDCCCRHCRRSNRAEKWYRTE